VTDDGISYASSLPAVRWRFAKENNTANLIGHAVLNGSEYGYDSSDALALRMELHDPATGRLQLGSSEDSLRTLASLGFTLPKAGVPMSAGIWNGAEVAGDANAHYLLQVSSSERFTITVTPSGGRTLADVAKPIPTQHQQPTSTLVDEDDDIHTASIGPASTGHPLLSTDELTLGRSYVYVGHRVRVDEPKTLFQKYGTMMLLGGMLLVNIYMRTRQTNSQLSAAQQQTARLTQPQGGVSGNRRPARSTAHIEEITEGTLPAFENKKGK
jgi:hypothetical protein